MIFINMPLQLDFINYLLKLFYSFLQRFVGDYQLRYYSDTHPSLHPSDGRRHRPIKGANRKTYISSLGKMGKNVSARHPEKPQCNNGRVSQLVMGDNRCFIEDMAGKVE